MCTALIRLDCGVSQHSLPAAGVQSPLVHSTRRTLVVTKLQRQRRRSAEPFGRPPLFIDLFAGCGGLSLGLAAAGWRGLFAAESNPDAFSTFSANLLAEPSHRPLASPFDWPTWLPKEPLDVSVLACDYLKQLQRLRGTVQLLVGGPPCQGFSSAGRRDARDRRNGLFRHVIRVADIVRPPLVLIENVRGIDVPLRSNGDNCSTRKTSSCRPRYSEKIRRSLEKVGYFAEQGVVRACDWGVPQLRPRFITLAIRSDLRSPDVPSFFELLLTHRAGFLGEKQLPVCTHVTVEDAISDLLVSEHELIPCEDPESAPGFLEIRYAQPRTAYQRLLHGDLNGARLNSLRLPNHRPDVRRRFKRILRTCRKGVQLSPADRTRLGIRKSILVPLSPERPSHTVTTLPDDLLHYCEPRIHTVREHARLQSFPDWFEFRGRFTTGGNRRRSQCPRYTQVGNAVPPLLSEGMGVALLSLLSLLLRKP